jgi:hypothetical protein
MHLKTAFEGNLERTSVVGIVRAAALLVGHNTLARGRDLGIDGSPNGALDPSRDITIAAFDWRAGARMSPPAFVLWMHPSKDPTQRKKRYPMLIQRRSATAPVGSDPLCTYDAVVRAWPILAESIPPGEWASTAFFRVPIAPEDPPSRWRPLTSDGVAGWVKEAALAAGLDPAAYGAKALRMAGASDLYDLYGPLAERYIRERGRWSSDVAQIYQRVSAATHGMLSRTIGDSTGPDLQSLLSGWSQTAVSHGRCPV